MFKPEILRTSLQFRLQDTAPGGAKRRGCRRDNDRTRGAVLALQPCGMYRLQRGTVIVCFSGQPINQCVAMATQLDEVMGGSTGSLRESASLHRAKSTDTIRYRRQSSINFDSVHITMGHYVLNRPSSFRSSAHGVINDALMLVQPPFRVSFPTE